MAPSAAWWGLGRYGALLLSDPGGKEATGIQPEWQLYGYRRRVGRAQRHVSDRGPFDNSPASQAGLKAGDILMRIDNEDATALTLGEVVQKIRGPAGSTVQLTILRPAESKTYEITITRREIDIPAASWAMIPDTQVALIRLSRFSQNAEWDMTTALQGAESAGATGLIVDMRNNPGGLLEQAIKVTSLFLREGNVLLEEDAQGNRTPFPVQPTEDVTDLPLVVLVNPGTASSAEIFAGAIQDQKRGQVVGETTIGTGTVLQPFNPAGWL